MHEPPEDNPTIDNEEKANEQQEDNEEQQDNEEQEVDNEERQESEHEEDEPETETELRRSTRTRKEVDQLNLNIHVILNTKKVTLIYRILGLTNFNSLLQYVNRLGWEVCSVN